MEPESHSEAAAPLTQPTGCCPPFDPAAWGQATVTWRDKPFVTDHVHCVMHVPIDMSSRILRNQRLIDAAQARPDRPLMLSTDTSAWGANLYIEVTRPVAGARMTTLSGKFSTKVYEGPYSNAGKWVADMRHYMLEQQQPIERLYLGYTTRPRCAKAYGKNYVVLFAQHAAGAQAASAA
jgi:hypothetical protein